MVKTKHRVTGIVLAVLLVLSTLLVGTASVAAVDNDDRSSGFVSNTAVSGMPSTLYFKPNSNWIVENARFAAFMLTTIITIGRSLPPLPESHSFINVLSRQQATG